MLKIISAQFQQTAPQKARSGFQFGKSLYENPTTAVPAAVGTAIDRRQRQRASFPCIHCKQPSQGKMDKQGNHICPTCETKMHGAPTAPVTPPATSNPSPHPIV